MEREHRLYFKVLEAIAAVIFLPMFILWLLWKDDNAKQGKVTEVGAVLTLVMYVCLLVLLGIYAR